MDESKFADLVKEIEESSPSLRVRKNADKVEVFGSFEVRGDKNLLVGRVQVRIDLDSEYPETIPKVYETEGKFPKSGNRHFNKDEDACLFVPDERWKHWPKGATFTQFLRGPVNEFFLNQVGYILDGKWILGERPHSTDGIIQSYRDELGFNDPVRIFNSIHLLSKPMIKGHWLCPCGSGHILRKCHWKQFFKLKERITPEQATKTLTFIRTAAKK